MLRHIPPDARLRTNEPAAPRHPSRPHRADLLTDILALQQTAGNQAVGSLLAPKRRQLQRFSETGHKAIGDEAFQEEWARQDLELAPGLTLTFGDAVAMGDYFSSFKSMQDLANKPGKGPGTRGEVLYVLWTKIWGHKEDKWDWYDGVAKRVANQRADQLTSTNISHFPNPITGDVGRPTADKATRHDASNVPVGGIAAYRSAHEKALALAVSAGRAQRPMDDALLADGFACHFLTDAFSASHARSPRLSIKEYWDAKVPDFHKKLKGWLIKEIVDAPWGAGKRVGAVIVKGGTISNLTADRVGLLLAGQDNSFGNVVSLIHHDYEGSLGVEATIQGVPITLVGDLDLMVLNAVAPTKVAEATFDAAVRATEASIKDMHDAYTAGWRSAQLAEVMKNLKGSDGLYRAERLIPIPVEDSQLPPAKQSRIWKHASIDLFLADSDVQQALVVWGSARAEALEEELAELADLPSDVRKVLERDLIAPLKSGKAQDIVSLIRTIIAHG